MSTNSQVCHSFIHESGTHRRSKNLFWEPLTPCGGKRALYSYGRHHMIAAITSRFVVVNYDSGFSKTTARHHREFAAAMPMSGYETHARHVNADSLWVARVPTPSVWVGSPHPASAIFTAAGDLARLTRMDGAKFGELVGRCRRSTRHADIFGWKLDAIIGNLAAAVSCLGWLSSDEPAYKEWPETLKDDAAQLIRTRVNPDPHHRGGFTMPQPVWVEFLSAVALYMLGDTHGRSRVFSYGDLIGQPEFLGSDAMSSPHMRDCVDELNAITDKIASQSHGAEMAARLAREEKTRQRHAAEFMSGERSRLNGATLIRLNGDRIETSLGVWFQLTPGAVETMRQVLARLTPGATYKPDEWAEFTLYSDDRQTPFQIRRHASGVSVGCHSFSVSDRDTLASVIDAAELKLNGVAS